jgi:hypothetical protein
VRWAGSRERISREHERRDEKKKSEILLGNTKIRKEYKLL